MADGSPSLQAPHNLAAEAAVLGAILFDNTAFRLVSEILDAEHFYAPAHQHIFGVIAAQIRAGMTADGVTLQEHFEAEARLTEIGGPKYLLELLDAAAFGPEVRDYAFLIRDLWTRRALMRFGAEVQAGAALMPSGSSGQSAAMAASAGLESILRTAMVRTRQIDMADEIMDGVIGRISERLSTGKALPSGISTGLADLDEQLGKMHPGDLIILAGRPGMGKEQPIDAQVLTPDGWRRFGDLQPGSQVIGRSGTPVTVTGVFPQGVKQSYRVTFRDGTSTECGLEHLWSVAPESGNGRDKYRALTLRQILEKGVTRQKIGRHGARWKVPLVEPVQFAEKRFLIDPYVLGVLIGDGSLCNPPDIRFSTPDFDRDIRDRVAVRIGPLELLENRSGACPYFSIRGHERVAMVAELQRLGLCVKSADKRIPPEYQLGSVAQRLDLLRGLMDTDGSCGVNNHVTFHTIAKALAEDVAGLVRSLGGVAIVNAYDRTDEGKPVEYQVNVKMSVAPFSSSRKLARWKPQTPSRYIWSVEPARMVEQMCITVDAPDHLYVTDDYIVTHNTALSLHLAHRSLRRDAQGFEHPARCAFFSLEMDADPLAHRVMSMAARAHRMGVVPYRNIRKGRIGQGEAATLKAAVAKLPKTVAWHTSGDLSLDEITAGCRQASRKLGGLDLVIIDYLQLIRFDIGRGENTASAIGRITKGLKALAKEIGVPIVCLSQLSREVEHRDNKRPQLSDLRDSGAIEQDADAVIFVYRDEYYLAKEEPKGGPGVSNARWHEWQNDLQGAKGVVELIAAKVRQGRPGTVKVYVEFETNTVVADKRELQEERMI